MTSKSVLGILGVAAGVVLTGSAFAQDAPPADAAPAADAAAAPAPEAAPVADVTPAVPEAAAAEAPVLPAGGDFASTSAAPEERNAGVFGYPFYVSPQFSYTLTDKIRHNKDAYGGTLAFGSRVLEFLAFEAAGSYSIAKNNSSFGGNSKLSSYGMNMLLFPLPSILPNFYGLAGVHYNHNQDQPVADTPTTVPGTATGATIHKRNFSDVGFLAGFGYWQPFTAFGMNAALRADVDLQQQEHKYFSFAASRDSGVRNSYSDIMFSLGLVIPLFSHPPVTTPAPPPPAEEPAVVPVAEAPPPAEPAPAPAPPPCRAPIAGEKVDLSGCASGDVIVLRGVNFDFNKATLTPNAKTILDQVADALKAAADIKVEIGGHTDGKGSSAYNQKLSQKRAESVKAYLVEHGIDAGRMTTKGYGKEHPIADNATDEGRELNRRVELKVME